MLIVFVYNTITSYYSLVHVSTLYKPSSGRNIVTRDAYDTCVCVCVCVCVCHKMQLCICEKYAIKTQMRKISIMCVSYKSVSP